LSRTKRELEAELAKQVASTEHLANQLSILTAEEGLPLEDLERALDIVRRQRGTRAITITLPSTMTSSSSSFVPVYVC
jgi:hypothetical protein